jgi:hypothetical protein
MHVQFEQETFDGAIGAIVQALQEIRGRVERGEVVLGAEQEAELQRLQSFVDRSNTQNYSESEMLSDLGLLFFRGMLNVNRDLVRAFECTEAAAQLGLPVAHSNLAFMYAEGGDYSQARLCWERYAAMDSVHAGDAMFNIGVLHRDGLGTPVDLSKALEWLKSAAERGHTQAAIAIQELEELQAAAIILESSSSDKTTGRD